MRELWVPLSAAIAQQNHIDILANNVANINTIGHKKDQVAFEEYLTSYSENYQNNESMNLPEKEWGPEDFYRTQGSEHSFVKTRGTYTDFSQGQVSPTGNKFDIALIGPGMIEVLAPDGLHYTRKGTLNISNNGELVTDNGSFILSPEKKNDLNSNEAEQENWKKRIIKIGNGPIDIDEKGQIFQNGSLISQISLVEFEDINALRKTGQSEYLNNLGKKNIKNNPIITKILQGNLEQSNVNAILEMSELIKANRSFEGINKIIKSFDQIEGKAANDISNF